MSKETILPFSFLLSGTQISEIHPKAFQMIEASELHFGVGM
jgi:hypothetical protein